MITNLIPDGTVKEWSDQRADPHAQLAAIRQWLDHLAAQDWVRTLCERALADDDLAARLGENAVEHPNGFDMLHLTGPLPTAATLPDYRVRLHIWWPERRDGTEDIHNHAWNFASRVITGALRFTTYTPTADPSAQRFFKYAYHFGSDGAYTDQDVETVRLHPSFDATLTTGTCYTLDHQALHRITPIGDHPAATLVVTGTTVRAGSDVYTEQPRHANGARIPRDPLGANAVRERLTRLTTTIDRGHERVDQTRASQWDRTEPCGCC